MPKVIAITLYRRPKYTQILFDALNRCYGIEDYTIFISCDYAPEHHDACSEVQAMAHRFSNAREECKTHIYYNNPRKGIDLNKLFILPKAYEMSDYVIFLEDDTIPAPDALRYFEWCRQFGNDPSCVAVCGYERYHPMDYHEKVLTRQPYAVLKKFKSFSSWGWAMWRDRYERLYGMDGMNYIPKVDSPNGRFDWHISWTYREGDYCLFSRMPRIQSIGGEMGEHTPNAAWHKENEFNPLGSWSQYMPDDTESWNLVDDVPSREELI
jgi:hypothetical protein